MRSNHLYCCWPIMWIIFLHPSLPYFFKASPHNIFYRQPKPDFTKPTQTDNPDYKSNKPATHLFHSHDHTFTKFISKVAGHSLYSKQHQHHQKT